MGFGGLHPFPKRMGGGKPLLEFILEGQNKGRGTALDTSPTSPVYVENMATARALEDAWSTNQRLANIRDPYRMAGSTLARWEKTLGIIADPSQSELTRRQAVAKLFARFGQPSVHQALVDLLTEELGDIFVAVEYISPDNATIHVPDGTYPFGTVATGVPWSSTVDHILVRTQKLDGMTEGQFYDAVARTFDIDPIIAAWLTFDWYRPGPLSTDYSPDGPSAAGFYLDDDHNLDNEIFDLP